MKIDANFTAYFLSSRKTFRDYTCHANALAVVCTRFDPRLVARIYTRRIIDNKLMATFVERMSGLSNRTDDNFRLP